MNLHIFIMKVNYYLNDKYTKYFIDENPYGENKKTLSKNYSHKTSLPIQTVREG